LISGDNSNETKVGLETAPADGDSITKEEFLSTSEGAIIGVNFARGNGYNGPRNYCCGLKNGKRKGGFLVSGDTSVKGNGEKLRGRGKGEQILPSTQREGLSLTSE